MSKENDRNLLFIKILILFFLVVFVASIVIIPLAWKIDSFPAWLWIVGINTMLVSLILLGILAFIRSIKKYSVKFDEAMKNAKLTDNNYNLLNGSTTIAQAKELFGKGIEILILCLMDQIL